MGGGGKSSTLLVSWSGDWGGDGQGGFRTKTSSESSWEASASSCCWSLQPARLDSEIRSEDGFRWGAGGDGVLLLHSGPFPSVSGGSPGPAAVTSPLAAVCRTPGKTMASRLTWLSLSLARHSAPPPGHCRPTEAAKVEVALPRWRSLLLLGRSLRGTGAPAGSATRRREVSTSTGGRADIKLQKVKHKSSPFLKTARFISETFTEILFF